MASRTLAAQPFLYVAFQTTLQHVTQRAANHLRRQEVSAFVIHLHSCAHIAASPGVLAIPQAKAEYL